MFTHARTALPRVGPGRPWREGAYKSAAFLSTHSLPVCWWVSSALL